MKKDNLQELQWESDFFSKKIATVIDVNALASTSFSNFQLITNKVSANDYSSINKLQNAGFLLSEGELVFNKNVCFNKETSIIKGDFEPHIATLEDIDELVNIAQLSFTSSRYREPWFNDTQRATFYGLWIKKAVTGEFDDICLTIKENDNIQGLVSLKKEKEQLKIGLIAIAKAYRGKGIASKLLKLVDLYANKYNCKKISVATQTSNINAANLYIKNGYTLFNSNYWLYKINS